MTTWMKRKTLVFAIGALLAGVASAQERLELVEESLLEADRAFAAETLEGGIDAWVSYFAEDGVRLDPRGEIIQGHDAIRAFDGPAFSDPDQRLRWTPREARAFGQAIGFTRGTYRVEQRVEGEEWKMVSTGRYLTWWRRGSLGWKVLLDTGTPDPPPPPAPPEAPSEADSE